VKVKLQTRFTQLLKLLKFSKCNTVDSQFIVILNLVLILSLVIFFWLLLNAVVQLMLDLVVLNLVLIQFSIIILELVILLLLTQLDDYYYVNITRISHMTRFYHEFAADQKYD